jgi:hypothetical protein
MPPPRGGAEQVTALRKAIGYVALWILMMAVRQDAWNWRDPSLVWGVLPVGLAYQVGYSLLAAVVMALLVRFDWPVELEGLEEPPGD